MGDQQPVKRITLTFDNGPDHSVTHHVLDVLAARGVHATFFVIGSKLESPDAWTVATRAHAEGHWIGNHTYSHDTPLGDIFDQPDIAEKEIGRTQNLLKPLAHPDRLFRPFGGGGQLNQQLLNRRCYDYLCANGYTCILWNAVPRDWEHPDGWAERALAELRIRAWTLLVLHDIDTGAMRHLEYFLDRLLEMEVEIRQDFPSDCVPMVRGRTAQSMDQYISS